MMANRRFLLCQRWLKINVPIYPVCIVYYISPRLFRPFTVIPENRKSPSGGRGEKKRIAVALLYCGNGKRQLMAWPRVLAHRVNCHVVCKSWPFPDMDACLDAIQGARRVAPHRLSPHAAGAAATGVLLFITLLNGLIKKL